MSRPLLLGLDIGTTRVKAVVVDEGGAEVAAADRTTPWHRTPGGGAELDAGVLTGLVRDVAGRAAGRAVAVTGGSVAGVGVTGMGEAGVLAGAHDEPLAPVRAWYDQRADVDLVRAELGETAFHQAVGMRLDAQPSLPKLVRLRADHPGATAATRFYSVPEWAVRGLGARPVSELSLASRTGLLDVVTARPWDGARFLLGADLLSELVVAGDDVGTAGDGGRGEVPPELRGATLTVAGHDHQAAALAAGAASDGTLFDSLGTAEALLRFTAGPVERAAVGELAAAHLTAGRTVIAGHWCVNQGLTSGFVLERVAAALGAAGREQRADLGRRAAALLAADADGARAAVRVEVLGEDRVRIELLDDEADPAAVWAATVRAVVDSARDGLRRVAAVIGPHRRVVAAGGWLANPAVLEAKRRQFPGLVTSGVTEAGAAGAAYLAGVARGLLPRPDPATAWPWSNPHTLREVPQ
jgi:sugar (pentulose or hexulose) kinase